MDASISDMLKGVLDDPDALGKLMGAAQSLMGNSAVPSAKEEKTEETPAERMAVKAEATAPAALSKRQDGRNGGNAERIALLSALRPYLSPERKQTADSLIYMLKMMKLADLNKLFPS